MGGCEDTEGGDVGLGECGGVTWVPTLIFRFLHWAQPCRDLR